MSVAVRTEQHNAHLTMFICISENCSEHIYRPTGATAHEEASTCMGRMQFKTASVHCTSVQTRITVLHVHLGIEVGMSDMVRLHVMW